MTYQIVFEGPIVSSATFDKADFTPKVLICVDQSGIIDRVISVEDSDYQSVKQRAEQQKILHILPPGNYLLPGFTDLHIHAPQWPQAGLALDRPLQEWLNTYTFPLEAKFKDLAYAEKVYRNLISELLANGTTTGLFFGSVDTDANLVLAKICAQLGQRAFIGKVAMDNPEQTPDFYRDNSSKEALDETKRFIEEVLKLQKTNSADITPVITPRFVPSCTDETLDGLGKLAAKYDLPVQTHCSESIWEDQYAIERFHKRDAQVLEQFGLLTDKTVLAHGTQLTDGDLELLRNKQTALAHCPISNVYFGNNVMRVKDAHDKNVKVGLGTDISGGFSPSIYRNMQQAIMSSQTLQDETNQNTRLTAANVFYLATVGGALALHLKTGRIKASFKADLQIVQDQYYELSSNHPQEIFERLIYHTNKENIKQVYVSGKLVHDNMGENNGK
ncbi:MAG TPA: guanine deaminase [Candidatus Companilactobacillus pullicola]|uniref:Guanine deaminase n=1 Tax=Candidatus Companilactobacillus pullicola TaxID=2838523 RepID=A0A9D2CPQ2_9LACO|nr:guanine deaminase [Candidatus Companilactobacillus pullicola]